MPTTEKGNVRKMTPNEYQKLAERTSATSQENVGEVSSQVFKSGINGFNRNLRLLHAGLGMATESGEFLDGLKKHIFYGADLDTVNLEEECGDLLWYIAEALNALGVDMENVMKVNITKLRARYPGKFSPEDALDRDLESEREVLERDCNET